VTDQQPPNFENKIQCPQRGSNNITAAGVCQDCSAALLLKDEGNQGKQSSLDEFITQENEVLETAGTKAAESAFGIGCWLGVLISLVLVAILFLSGIRNPIILGLSIIAALMLTSGISTLFSSRAKSATIAGVFQREVSPRIEDYLKTHQLSRLEFDETVKTLLDSAAPLSGHFSKAESKEPASSKE
jgi:hypothetical protein